MKRRTFLGLFPALAAAARMAPALKPEAPPQTITTAGAPLQVGDILEAEEPIEFRDFTGGAFLICSTCVSPRYGWPDNER